MSQEFVKFSRDGVLWAAGLFEGEGCFTKHGNAFMLLMDSTDKDVLETFKSVFPFVNLRGPYLNKNKPHHKPRFRIDAHGPKAAAIGYAIYPFLGERRKQKFVDLLELYKQV